METISAHIGIKKYGNIPHLKESRLGQARHHISEGQQIIATQKTRDFRDLIIVQEKLDGTNVGIYKHTDNQLVAFSRSGNLAETSPYLHHQEFHHFVSQTKYTQVFQKILLPGERIYGEWLTLAHGTQYHLPHIPYVAFDIFTVEDRRLTYLEFIQRIGHYLPTPRVIHIGQPMPLKYVLKILNPSGHGAIEPIEGAIWRIEREGKVDFMCKYVRPDKIDGKYLPEISGRRIYNQYEAYV